MPMRCEKHEGMGFTYCNLCEVESLRDQIDCLESALRAIYDRCIETDYPAANIAEKALGWLK
jgi:hypothetical protein